MKSRKVKVEMESKDWRGWDLFWIIKFKMAVSILEYISVFGTNGWEDG